MDLVYTIKSSLLKLQFFQTYRYRSSISNPLRTTHQDLRIFPETFWRIFFKRKKILFYPEKPKPIFVLYKILLYLGYTITDDYSKYCHLAIKWRNAFDGDPFLPDEKPLDRFAKSWPNNTMINYKCNDVSKMRVGEVFQDIFGYSLSVDPEKFTGDCVMKSNWNGLHVGQIIKCPVKENKEGFVYEKLIRNELENGFVEDIRVPIFRKIIPFVYLKYRPVNQRLVDRSHANKKVVITEAHDKLSSMEIQKILEFCEKIGLDYGEIDVLRDKYDGKIYIIDVNNNPAGPPAPISEKDEKTAIIRLAKAFEQAFDT